ncbi:MAG: C25 family cysteine peptidase [Ginsengibacter sp.]
MMKKISVLLFILFSVATVGISQPATNSWIKYGQPYYKFTLGQDGLYHLNKSVLNQAGLGNIPVEQFQLWRNGEQQILYTSIISGSLGTNDYIEFWGLKNDGKTDSKLYLKPDYQLSDHYSLQTDTAAYFLTVNAGGGNLRFINGQNNVAGNLLSPEPYFMNVTGNYFNTKVNPGYGVSAGDVYVYSSSYDQGEGWTSRDIRSSSPLTGTITGVNIYSAGPPVSVNYGVAGAAYGSRNVTISVNDMVIATETISYLASKKNEVTNLPTSLIKTPSVSYTFNNTSSSSTDRVVASHIEIRYPSKWDFNNQNNFYFEIPASNVGNYLEIINFNSGGIQPALFDLSSGMRYLGDISTAGKVKFALPASATPIRKFRLVSLSPALVQNIASLNQVSFVDYSQTANQGDYLIISNKILFNSKAGTNNVDMYRQYRSSAAGGSFNAKIIDIDQLVDQFAYGIKKHPRAVKDFIAFAKNNFSVTPKDVLIIGKGVVYDEYVQNPGSAYREQLNLVPTFGSPASDVVLVAPYGSAVPTFPVGRISVVNGEELGNYLEKVKEYEAAQKSAVQTIDSKLWMKNVVQIVGGKDEDENNEFTSYMSNYGKIFKDTSYGAHIELFSKTSSAAVQLLASQRIDELFKEGISILTYFGHSSANTLEFNLSDPYSYDNPQKYPVFLVSGCTAGNNFSFDTLRILQNNFTISENFLIAKQRGTIGFLASTHFGIPNYLDDYNNLFYTQLASKNYQGSIGESMRRTIEQLGGNNEGTTFFARADYEENNLNGDPAIRVNPHDKPDYVVEDQLVKLNPAFISIAEEKFVVNAKTYNIGKAVNDSINFEIRRTYPDGKTDLLLKKRIKAPNYEDSLQITVPIIPTRDKGLNKITVTIDPENEVPEMSESNNSVTKEFYIYEDEARPAFPVNFAIINDPAQKLFASTATIQGNPKDYDLDIDTTQLFNSPVKVRRTLNSTGGLLEFDAGFPFKDNTVYYWRVATRPVSGLDGDYRWNNSSFIYLANGGPGAGQSHYFQHLSSDTERITLNANRKWQFDKVANTIESRNGVFPTAASTAADFKLSVNGADIAASVCGISGIIFSVLNPQTLEPLYNTYAGRYGSDPVCGVERLANFQFNILDINKRKAAMSFLNDSIPDNYIVIVRNVSGTDPNTNTYAADWKADEAVFGTGKSMYLALKSQGFSTIDEFDRPRSFIFMYQKNNPSFGPSNIFSTGISDKIVLDHQAISDDSVGMITSPQFGPALDWKQMNWDGNSVEPVSDDNPQIQIIGVNNNGDQSVLFNINKSQKSVNLSSVDAKQYPFIQLKMRNADSVQFTPYQLSYWRLNFTPAPEGALAPQLLFSSKDTLQQGEILHFGIAFKNISNTSFDSVKINLSIIDTNNVTRPFLFPRVKPLVKGDTILFKYDIDTKLLSGNNTLFVDFNPNNDQPEQYHFNNFLYRKFFVQGDVFNPTLDVTFDGVHILNQDIVSARPHILIKLKDDSKYLALNDTSLFKVQIRFPDGVLHDYHFDNDTMRLIPADLASGQNTATIDLQPTLGGEDADYELLVSGKDAMGNRSGELDYHINFKVISKPMISNMLNYPNPFTTSTAFVFTITGTEVPQNIRIQILTITGKVVREITSQELGQLHIGRNITDFKWDGTDMYGQSVGNGVYLYRVLTNLNGKSLEKYSTQDSNTDLYFTKGYGKMYLMR